MSDEPQAPDPTPEQAQQVSAAAGKSIIESQQQGHSEEETRKAATEAMQKKADEVGMRLHPEEREQVADTFIDKLRTMGVFDAPPAPEPVPAADEVTPTPEQAAATAAQAASPEPPRKKTLAEKFAGI